MVCCSKKYSLDALTITKWFGLQPIGFNKDLTLKPGVTLQNLMPLLIQTLFLAYYIIIKSVSQVILTSRKFTSFAEGANELSWVIVDALNAVSYILIVKNQKLYLSAIREIKKSLTSSQESQLKVERSGHIKFFLVTTFFVFLFVFYPYLITTDNFDAAHKMLNGNQTVINAILIMPCRMVYLMQEVNQLLILLWMSLLIDAAVVRIRAIKTNVAEDANTNPLEILTAIELIDGSFKRFLSPIILIHIIQQGLAILNFMNSYLAGKLFSDILLVLTRIICMWIWTNEGNKFIDEVMFIPDTLRRWLSTHKFHQHDNAFLSAGFYSYNIYFSVEQFKNILWTLVKMTHL